MTSEAELKTVMYEGAAAPLSQHFTIGNQCAPHNSARRSSSHCRKSYSLSGSAHAEQKRVPLCSQNLLVRLPRLDCKARFRYQPTPRATAAAFRHDAKPIGAF